MTSNTIEVTEVRTGVAHAVYVAGGKSKLAAMLGVSPQVIGQWVKRGYVPPGRVVEIETMLGVPRSKLINPKIANLVDSLTPKSGEL